MMRRVVAGLDENQRSTVVSDGAPAIVFASTTRTDERTLPVRIQTLVDDAPVGQSIAAPLWATDPSGEDREPFLDDAAVPDGMCEPGASTWQFVRMGPECWIDMHETPTVDYDLVLSGEVELVLEEDAVLLKAGDAFVIPGVRHAWRTGRQGCTMAVVMLGRA